MGFRTEKMRLFGFGVFCGFQVFLLLAHWFSDSLTDVVFGFSHLVFGFAVAIMTSKCKFKLYNLAYD